MDEKKNSQCLLWALPITQGQQTQLDLPQVQHLPHHQHTPLEMWFQRLLCLISSSKVTYCHFSSDGKLLASGHHDKKAVLWYTNTLKPKSTLEEHACLITDVRFSPSMSRLATSSFDKTVRVWDADSVSGLFSFLLLVIVLAFELIMSSCMPMLLPI